MLFSSKNSTNQQIGCLLVDWFVKNRRILPWRTDPSIYNRLVSEFMLQQTQVATVIPYFNRWIEQFPSIEVLARASEEQVLKAWEGLGYYSRVKNLHKTAKKIFNQQINLTTSKHFGFPKTPEEWKIFPGIGDYTAHALASIAQNQCVAAIDGNVIRVLCRIHGIQQTFESKNQAVKYIKNIAHAHIPFDENANYNEAIMEFGALICKAKNPTCDRCPIAFHCHSFQKKLDRSQIPRFKKIVYVKKIIQRIFISDERYIILKKANTNRLHNIFELPLLDDIHEKTPTLEIAKINRSIAHERITEIILSPKHQNFKILLKKNTELTLLSIQELKSITLSGPHRKWLDGYLPAHFVSDVMTKN
ncbi:MAG: A/G-specific adenine glycosylase [Puniceicoccales bacterium]|jgi:A/G-specific adenine glycosylase|nr:A/G-specific adenine glycosylase [Puniceicoccales bacterium]